MAKWHIQVGNSEFFVSDHKSLTFGIMPEGLTQKQAISTLDKLADMQRISSVNPDTYKLICVEKSI
jgi:hypothetical protein